VERLVASAVLLLALLAPIAARADDYGPRPDIAAIRHDLPILTRQATPIESVKIDGDSATVLLRNGNEHTEILLRKLYGRWWYERTTRIFYDQPSPGPCTGILCARSATGDDEIDPAWPYGGDISFDPGRQWDNDGGYRVTLFFAPHDPSQVVKVANFVGRIPTEAESWANPPSGNAYFFFSGTVQSSQPVHVQAGTTLDVWFPFVLDTSLKYSLTIVAPDKMSLGPVEGTLKDNMLHFVLPAFTAPPGAELMGEIDSD
jgi:hypothetical protein